MALRDEELFKGMSYLDISLTGSMAVEFIHEFNDETEKLMSKIATALASSSSTFHIYLATSSLPKLSGHFREILASTPSSNLKLQTGKGLVSDPKSDVEPSPCGTS